MSSNALTAASVVTSSRAPDNDTSSAIPRDPLAASELPFRPTVIAQVKTYQRHRCWACGSDESPEVAHVIANGR
jgi:hypothetical protein